MHALWNEKGSSKPARPSGQLAYVSNYLAKCSGQKRQKRPKTAKNGQKRPKTAKKWPKNVQKLSSRILQKLHVNSSGHHPTYPIWPNAAKSGQI